MDKKQHLKCGYVALLGLPNAGKSTLANDLVGGKVSIVTPKAQTSRFNTLGIVNWGDVQAIFIDPPGIFAPKRKLDRAMVKSAWASTHDADIVLLLMDARRALSDANLELLEGFGKRRVENKKCLLVLNKIDLIARGELLPIVDGIKDKGSFDGVFLVSALKGDGVRDLKEAVGLALPKGPWLYPEDSLTTLTDRQMAAELVREQIFLQLQEELPYHAAVEVGRFEERKDGSVRIEADILVSRQGQKAIFIGEGGQRLKSVGAKARAEIGRVLGRPCHLFLTVRERAGWDEENARLRAMGLDVNV